MTTERLHIGKIVGVHGIQGAFKVVTDIANPDVLADIEDVHIITKKKYKFDSKVSSLKLDRGTIVMTIQACKDRDSAELLIGSMIYTERAQVGDLEEDEFWVRDLIGVDVFTTDGAHVGVVVDVVTGSNQLLEIKKDGAKEDDDTKLVPFVTALVPKVDMKARRIEVVNLPGLLD